MELWSPSLIVVVARRQPAPQMKGYLLDRQDDPRIQSMVASQSQLPQSDRYPNHNYSGAYPSSIGTSQMASGPTRTTNTDPSGSLPALSSTASSRSYIGSEGSYGGGASTKNWLLEESGGALQIPSTPPAGPLECPFNFLSCYRNFSSNYEWYYHSLTHFGSVGPPCTNNCCFCDMHFVNSDGRHSWKERLDHIASMHHGIGHRLAAARPDIDLIKYLWDKGLIRKEIYNYLNPPVAPDYSSQSGPTNQSGSINMDFAYTMKSSSRARDRGGRSSRR